MHMTASRPNSEELVSGEVTRAGHKRLRTSVACETCRKRKLKCDAGKPSCSACRRRDIGCVYEQGRHTQPGRSVPVSSIINTLEIHGNIPIETVEIDYEYERPGSLSGGSTRHSQNETQDVEMGMSSRGSSRL